MPVPPAMPAIVAAAALLMATQAASAGTRLPPQNIGVLSCSIICMGKFGPGGFKPDHLARSCRNNLTGAWQWIDLVPRKPCNP
jgi:hypothetical protein